jgi:hypothetical protein
MKSTPILALPALGLIVAGTTLGGPFMASWVGSRLHIHARHHRWAIGESGS